MRGKKDKQTGGGNDPNGEAIDGAKENGGYLEWEDTETGQESGDTSMDPMESNKWEKSEDKVVMNMEDSN